jgi:hypothetical protein
MIEDNSTVRIVSADGGGEIARLAHPAGDTCVRVTISPKGQRIVTTSHPEKEPDKSKWVYRLWQSNPWREVPEPSLASMVRDDLVQFLSESDLRVWHSEHYTTEAGHGVMTHWQDVRIGRRVETEVQYGDCLFGGALYVRDGPRFFDGLTLDLISPGAGRKYPTAIKRFAADGRLVLIPGRVIDTTTDKSFEIGNEWHAGDTPGYTPGFGISVVIKSGVRILPDVRKLGIEAGVLELWAQVAVRGELGEDGTFNKWDEATWEQKRHELAAVTPPHPDFPFPGHVATDKLHWVRAEFDEAKTEAERLRLAAVLLRRAEEHGDKVESTRWREEIRKRTREVLPPPRQAK